MRTGMIVVCALLAASPAFAHKEDVQPNTPIDRNKVVCKTEDVIGSRLQTEKHCMTIAQWDQLEHEGRNTMDKMQGRSSFQGH